MELTILGEQIIIGKYHKKLYIFNILHYYVVSTIRCMFYNFGYKLDKIRSIFSALQFTTLVLYSIGSATGKSWGGEGSWTKHQIEMLLRNF